jgi:hypothetical protein
MAPTSAFIAGARLRRPSGRLLVPALLLLALLGYIGVQRRATTTTANANAGAESSTVASGATRGTFVDGDERSTWTLTAAADGSISIEDDARFGDDGQANRVFTFDKQGRLVRATEQRSQTVQSGDRSPAPMRTELIVDFTKSVPVARKMVDGTPHDVQSFEIDNIRRRANALRAQAHH